MSVALGDFFRITNLSLVRWLAMVAASRLRPEKEHNDKTDQGDDDDIDLAVSIKSIPIVRAGLYCPVHVKNCRNNKQSDAAMPGAWLRKKVRHPWDGGPHRIMYFATLAERPRSRA
jgi:hypothetical protein